MSNTHVVTIEWGGISPPTSFYSQLYKRKRRSEITMGKYNDVICKSETIADEIACLAKSMGAADTGIIPISDYANNILSYENRSFLSMVENRDINGLLRLGGEIAEIMREFRIVEIIATIPVEE